MIYNEICPTSETAAKKLEKLEEELCVEIDINRKMTDMKRLTVVQKLRSFQYRHLMDAIITNIQLKRWGIKDSNQCTMCREERETCYHMFIECKCVQPIWEEVSKLIREITGVTPDINYRNVVLCEVIKPNSSVIVGI